MKLGLKRIIATASDRTQPYVQSVLMLLAPCRHTYLLIAGHVDECASWYVNVVHLDVADCSAQPSVPVDQAVITVDAARLKHAHKRLQHSPLGVM